VEVHVATSPLGPYNMTGQLLPDGGAWGGQTGAVWFAGDDWVLTGDRWQSAPDHIKAHDFTYTLPLTFLDDGTLQTVTAFQDNVTINLGPGGSA
jgi:hypothetical protein